MDDSASREMTVEERCADLRAKLKAIEENVRMFPNHSIFSGEQTHFNQHGEMKANIMLALRHIEDARMRRAPILREEY